MSIDPLLAGVWLGFVLGYFAALLVGRDTRRGR